jgi:hypothetical protein
MYSSVIPREGVESLNEVDAELNLFLQVIPREGVESSSALTFSMTSPSGDPERGS